MSKAFERGIGDSLSRLPAKRASKIVARMDLSDKAALGRSWPDWAGPAQRPPPGDWRVWLMIAGRGFGKTRAGAEWVTKLARRTGRIRIALVAATMDEARAVMIEGASGLLACADPKRPPRWEPSLGRLSFRSGAQAFLYSAENPEGLRGPEHQFAWCDELAKWGKGGEAAWHNLMLGLRQGERQRVLVTTTPRPGKLLKRLMADPAVVRTGGRTADNVHLPEGFVAAVTASYAGTRLGRQELDGELIEDVEGALWTRAIVEGARIQFLPGTGRWQAKGLTEGWAATSEQPLHQASPGPPPRSGDELVRIVVAVDPPASAEGDACGIVAAGLGRDGVGYVLEDASVERASPERWASAVSACAARWGADRVIAEANNGGEMVRSVLRAHDPALPVSLVHASRGKSARAEPVALLYEQGRVRHVGAFAALEDQLCGMLTGGGYEGPGRSPDRADALVWALTELMLKPRRAEPRIVVF